MPAIGDPPLPVVQESKTVHGAPAPVSYVPAPLQKEELRSAGAARLRSASARKAEETRSCQLRVASIPSAAGSSYVEQGRTKIIASVYGPRQVGERQQNPAEGTLLLDLQFSPFCSSSASREENEKRAVLYNTLLQRTFESVVLLERYPKTAIDVNIMVLEDDGAVLTAALAAASLSLADARIEMRDLVAGATVHLAASEGGGGGTLLLDCSGEEERAMPEGSAVLHVGLCPSRGALCLLHSAGPLPAGPFEQMVLLAKETAEAIGAEMRRCLERRVERRMAKRAREESGEAARRAPAAPAAQRLEVAGR